MSSQWTQQEFLDFVELHQPKHRTTAELFLNDIQDILEINWSDRAIKNIGFNARIIYKNISYPFIEYRGKYDYIYLKIEDLCTKSNINSSEMMKLFTGYIYEKNNNKYPLISLDSLKNENTIKKFVLLLTKVTNFESMS